MKYILGSLAFITGLSLLILSSISKSLFWTQVTWFSVGAVLIALAYFVNWKAMLGYKGVVWGFYIFSIALLVITYLTAPVIRNTRSWLVIGPFQYQTVELVKIALILVFARYFSKRHLAVARIKHIFNSFFLFILPAGLTLLQPDLGSATVLFGIWMGFLLLSGMPKDRLIAGLIIMAVLGTIGWFSFLEDYQRQRIVGVFYPERDVLGTNYSATQSKIAIGSAGLFGKGYGQGTQTQLGFLTEPGTDFIFAALIEEWGLVAGFLVVAAFLTLVFQIIKVGILANQNFEKFICAGTVIIFGWQFLVNVGTSLGIVPVIGLPFPFLSYGGSNLLTNFFLLSIIISIARRS